jgi:hypothetical protein
MDVATRTTSPLGCDPAGAGRGRRRPPFARVAFTSGSCVVLRTGPGIATWARGRCGRGRDPAGAGQGAQRPDVCDVGTALLPSVVTSGDHARGFVQNSVSIESQS